MSSSEETIEARARRIAERVAASAGLEIVDVEWRGGARRGVLRVFIDKPAGVTHADCETVSKQMSTILDVEDVGPSGAYHLEVSSPGLDRKLTKPDDYRRFSGRKAKLRLTRSVEGREEFTGRLGGLEDDQVVVDLGDGRAVRIPLDAVGQARLVVEI